MEQAKLYVGLDVHARTIDVSVLRRTGTPEEWQLANEPKAVAALARRLAPSRSGLPLFFEGVELATVRF